MRKILGIVLWLCALSAGDLLAQPMGDPVADSLMRVRMDSLVATDKEFCTVPAQIRLDRDNVLIASPSILATPEIGLGIGAYSLYYFNVDKSCLCTHPSKVENTTYYTLNNQFSSTTVWEVFTKNDGYVWSGIGIFQLFNEDFYGIGNQLFDQKENYSFNFFRIQTKFEKRVWNRLFSGLNYHGQYLYDMQSNDKNGALYNKRVLGAQGGLNSGLGVSVTWDTRNIPLNTTRGEFYDITAFAYGPYLGGQYTFSSVALDLRKYFPLQKQDEVVAVQVFGQAMMGDVPYRMLSMMGGMYLMRGYYIGKYRDLQYLAGQVEYRRPLFWRINGAVFAAVGTVAPKFDEIKTDYIRPSFGFGLRYVYDRRQRLTIRGDLGITSQGDIGYYFTVGEAF